MDPVRKFTFDTEFDVAGRVVRAPVREKKHFTKEDVEAARQEGYAAGEASALAAAEAEIAAVLAQFVAALQAVQARLDHESHALRREAVDVALAAARIAAGEALARFGDAVVLGLFDEVADHLRAAPRVAVCVGGDEQGDKLRNHLEQAAEAAGCAAALRVTQDEAGAPGDVAIAWEAGSVDRALTDILADIRAAAERWLTAQAAGLDTPHAAQLSLFDTLDATASTTQEAHHGG